MVEHDRIPMRFGVRATDSTQLTPSERRVAELAATGMSNRAIASALFIQAKTVEHNRAFHPRWLWHFTGGARPQGPDPHIAGCPVQDPADLSIDADDFLHR